MSEYKCIKSTVGGICLNEQGQVLLALRNHEPFYDHWCIPGGHMDFGETPEQAVQREINEETGLDTDKLSFFRYYNEYYPERDWHAVALVFIAHVSGQLQLQQSEVKQLKWFQIDQALQEKLAFEHHKVLSDYKNSL